MTEHHKPTDIASSGHDDAAETQAGKATAALADAVAKRNEARKSSDRGAGRGAHGGKPVSNLKVSSQVRGKQA